MGEKDYMLLFSVNKYLEVIGRDFLSTLFMVVSPVPRAVPESISGVKINK